MKTWGSRRFPRRALSRGEKLKSQVKWRLDKVVTVNSTLRPCLLRPTSNNTNNASGHRKAQVKSPHTDSEGRELSGRGGPGDRCPLGCTRTASSSRPFGRASLGRYESTLPASRRSANPSFRQG
eukprot:4652654-Pyramimonas_sp.AAC.2